jgi:hypothetical protein
MAGEAEAAKRPRVLAPPGDSAISQYVEVVPTDSGPTPSDPTGQPTGTLAPVQRSSLATLGADGHTLALLVQRTAPAKRGPAAAPEQPGALPSNSTTTTPAVDPVEGVRARSTASLLLEAAGGGAGGGIGFPGAAMLIASGAAGLAVGRRRRRMRR